ncbi:MAG: cobalamin biosynthesis protein, partial [Halovenus sp.]
AADALAAIAGAAEIDHSVSEHTSTHDASIVRIEDEYELQVFGAPAERASAALGLPLEGEPGGYRFDAFADHRSSLLRGILEACGTICFRESSSSVGISFVHDDEQLLETVRSLLADTEPRVPTDDLSESSSGGYWFGLGDDAEVDRFAAWLYADSDETGLFSAERQQKLARSVERATDREVGSLS